MKKLLLLILLLISLVSYSQREVKLINKGIFKVEYSEFFKNPLKVTYKIYKPKFIVERNSLNFYSEEGVKTATNKDYESNPYDKGHMAPAETFSDTEAHIKQTFTYVNCAVQHNKLNRGLWKVLEMKEREYSQTDSILVINEVIFIKPYKQLSTGAYIPDKFRKTIIFLSTRKRLVYEFPNTETTHSINDYEIKKGR